LKPTIYLALVDDWELRGNGSGDMAKIQFEPIRKLVSIYNKYGIRGTFNAEVMQQLSCRRLQPKHQELKMLADTWDHILLETHSQGHDIQLHIHPQWLDAEYTDGKWLLKANWSILKHNPDEVYKMLLAGKEYLEKLLQPADSNYRCVSFRSGAWCIAPSPFIMQLLVKIGIVFDISIVAGIRYDNKNIQLDYASCEEGFLPFYPVMEDARKVSHQAEKIICVPTNHFYASRFFVFRSLLAKIKSRIHKSKQNVINEPPYTEWEVKNDNFFKRQLIRSLKGYYYISDISLFDYPFLSEMMKQIRKRAKRTGLAQIPIVLENHTKDIKDFSHIEKFIRDLADSDDIQCITLTEMAEKLMNRDFLIVKRSD
jgi:hypothetical protein